MTNRQRMPPRTMVTSRALAAFWSFRDNVIFIKHLTGLLFANHDASGLDVLAVGDAARLGDHGFPGQLEDLDGIGPFVDRRREAAEHRVAGAAGEQIEL